VSVVIPDHELLSVIGRGAYGEVWLARNVMGVGRAVKIVRRDEFADARPYEREFAGIRRYEPLSRQAQGLVNVLHVGRNDEAGYFYYVMELTDAAPGKESEGYQAKNLRTALRGGALRDGECAGIALSLANALVMLHEAGLVHRDIKPSNIIFVGGAAKLADIGLVIEQGESRSFVGTEGYIAPEGPGSPQGDIFSLGIVLYEMLTGRDGREFPGVPAGFATGQPMVVELLEVVIRACEHDPASRYLTAREMAADLALVSGGKSVRELRSMQGRLRVLRRAAVFLVMAGFIAAGTMWWFCNRPKPAQTVTVAPGAGPISFSPDGKFLITADSREVARWRFPFAAGAQPENRYPTRMTTAILWSPDGTMHTSGYQPAAEFDPAWAAVRAVDFPPQNVDSESWSSDSQTRIVTQQANGARTGKAAIYRNGKLVRSHEVVAKDEAIIGLRSALSPDGRWAAMGAFKGIGWHVWSTETGSEAAQGSDAATLSFSPDGAWLAAAGAVENEVWRTADWQRIQHWRRVDLDAHFGQAAWSADSRKLAILPGRQTIRVLDTAKWAELATFQSSSPGHFASLAFHPAGKKLAAASTSGVVQVFDLL
jgi:WD40 repeat protein